MTFEDMLPRVAVYTPGCPPQTQLLHLVDAAKSFCRRSLAWSVELGPINSAAAQADYALPLPAATALVRVLGCDFNDGTRYYPRTGARGRAAVRSRSSNVCAVSATGTLTLTPAPPWSGKPIVVEAVLMPDESGETDWPDELAEHVEFIAAGAIGTLCAMPKQAGATWFDPTTATDQRAKFEQRVQSVYHRVAQSALRPPAAIRPMF